MRVMEVSIEENTGNIEMVTPPRKKLKQAQLPFQMVNPLASSNMNSTKKRKLDSPSPVERHSSRTGKAAKKQNAAKRAKGSELEVIELTLTADEEDVADQENNKRIIDQGDNKESKESVVGKESTKADEKKEQKKEKNEETDVKKKKDYNVLNMFLKKAQSQDAKDDIQLLAMSDYESGNSKDSDATMKNKVEVEGAKSKTPGESLVKESDSIKETEERQKSDVEKEEESENKEKAAEDLDNKNSDDLRRNKKDSVTSDDDDGKNGDSDSDLRASSSDEDADDEPEKSGNENGDKDKSSEGNDGSKTPRDKSTTLRNRKLTPKQIERRLQSAKKREEKQRLKQEKEKKREEEREIRRKEKEEKREEEREIRRKEREEKRKEKEEKEKAEKEQKRKDKEMKDLKKQIETEQKQKEKEAKEEERRKRDEEKLEAERKKQKAASNFANFFVAKKQENKAPEEDIVVKDQIFMPFEVKVDMRVAPIIRRNLNEENKLNFDGLFNKDLPQTELYLNELKRNPGVVGRAEKTWPYEAKDDVVIIDEDDGSSDAVDPGSAPVTEKHRPKLFLFAENRRPPFWGTWRKKSDHINPRRPFAKDSKWFDYDVDSDDEWEEEEPGESIRGSDDERDEEGPEENEYDVDNDFMVPHGYLSDEEAKADEEDGEDMSPETQKLKLKLLGEQFEAERKTKTSKIKPKVIGCVWQGSVNAYPENTAPNVVQILLARQAWVTEIPIVLRVASSVAESLPINSADCGSPSAQTGSKKTQVPEEVVPNLIRLVHGNINGRMFLVKEFMAFWHKNKTGDSKMSKVSVAQKIKEIASWTACPEEGPLHLRSCWYVREEVRKEYNCLEITLPNRWEYTLRPTRRSDVADVEKPEKTEKDKEKKRIPLITQFTKKITQEEMQKQLVSKPNTSACKPPKRVALISVPRGEQFQQSSRNDSKREEKQETKSPSDSKVEEIIHLEDFYETKTDVGRKDPTHDPQASVDLEQVDETPSGSRKSTGHVTVANNKSLVASQTETEDDCVVISDD